MEPTLSFSSAHEQLTTGSLTCSELVASFLARIEATRASNWFVEVYAESALQQAAQLDELISRGEKPPLAGLVIGAKDVLALEGRGMQAGSAILNGFRSAFTATALQRLTDLGAIVIGRQNCDEFAMGSSNEHSCYGPAAHPLDPARVPGGSSGASAAAVAAGCCHASLGSDTGGSVRQPASFCGVVGLKPTYGKVSRWGLLAYASSFDQIGPLTHTVRDAALLFDAMAGPDDRDHTLLPQPHQPVSPQLDLPFDRPLRIGVLQETLAPEGQDPALPPAMNQLFQRLRDLGHSVEACSFPLLEAMVPCYYLLTTAEASSNLSRYDGVHYGKRSSKARDLTEMYVRSRTEGFGEEVKKRILLGTFVLSEGYVDAYFTHAQRVRQRIRTETLALFEKFDLLLSPTSPTAAFRQGEKLDDPVAMYLSDIFTVHANLAGIPAMSIPLTVNAEGLPLGLQLMAAPWQEALMLRAAHQWLPDGKRFVLGMSQEKK